MKNYLSLFCFLFLASSISFGYLVPGPGSGGGPKPPDSQPNPPQYDPSYPDKPEQTPNDPPTYPYDDGGYSDSNWYDDLGKCYLSNIVTGSTQYCAQSKGVGDQVDHQLSLTWHRPQFQMGRAETQISYSADLIKNFLPLSKTTRFLKIGAKIHIHFQSPEDVLKWHNQVVESGSSQSSLQTQEGTWEVLWSHVGSLNRDEVTCIHKRGSKWNFGKVVLDQFIYSSEGPVWTCQEENSKIIRNVYYVESTISNGKGMKIDQNSNLVLKIPFSATIKSLGAIVRVRR